MGNTLTSVGYSEHLLSEEMAVEGIGVVVRPGPSSSQEGGASIRGVTCAQSSASVPTSTDVLSCGWAMVSSSWGRAWCREDAATFISVLPAPQLSLPRRKLPQALGTVPGHACSGCGLLAGRAVGAAHPPWWQCRLRRQRAESSPALHSEQHGHQEYEEEPCAVYTS